jgi:hypothetical protein
MPLRRTKSDLWTNATPDQVRARALTVRVYAFRLTDERAAHDLEAYADELEAQASEMEQSDPHEAAFSKH